MSNKKVWMTPTFQDAAQETSNAINQIVVRLHKHLPEFGWELTANEDEADLRAGHAGQGSQKPIDVAHVHGLYPTAVHSEHAWHWAANRAVINNIMTARQVTVPSEWVADTLRRDMHLDPHVIGWGIDPDEWSPNTEPDEGYVLWNKTRADGVCDPMPLLELAKRAVTERFVTTFGEGGSNVKTIGRQERLDMKDIIKRSHVYLATTRETFGIGTLEAMCAGKPILGYRWAGTADIVQHGVTGFLAEPGDIDGLVKGLQYIESHYDTLSHNAQLVAGLYTWEKVAEQFARVYDMAMQRPKFKLAVVIPVHNYGHYVTEAIASVRAQQTDFCFQIIVVDDRSTDDSIPKAEAALEESPNHKVIVTTDTQGPAGARNLGISIADAEYILCLDADDQIAPGVPMLQELANALDKDRLLGIAYTGLAVLEDGKIAPSPWPDGFSFEAQITYNNQVPTCCMFRKEAWRRAGGYRGAYEPAEDAELWTHMIARGYSAAHVIKQPWFIYRVHPDSLSRTRRTPNWLVRHTWIKTEKRPCAAPPPPGRYQTNAVRDYDAPLFSIIIPCGEGHEKYLKDALISVEAQTDDRWECIVILDQGYVLEPGVWDAFPWVKWKWVGDPPRGPGFARNVGASAARGKFLVFLDADDFIYPDFLDLTYRKYQETGRYVYTDWMSIAKDGTMEHHQCPEYDPQALFRQMSIHAVTILIPRVDFWAVGGFMTTLGAWEDVELYLKLAAAGYCGVRVARPLLVYRYQTGNLREYGETIKEQIKAKLFALYQPYMEGQKVCSCDEVVGQRSMAAVTFALPEDDKVMRVRMDGPAAPAAKMAIKGESGQSYERRERGEVFLILKVDYPSMRNMVSPYTEYQAEPAVTVMPPAPPYLKLEREQLFQSTGGQS